MARFFIISFNGRRTNNLLLTRPRPSPNRFFASESEQVHMFFFANWRKGEGGGDAGDGGGGGAVGGGTRRWGATATSGGGLAPTVTAVPMG
jgi:hypothetical protein